MESLDSSPIMENDHASIHLYYREPMGSNSVLWLLSEYVSLIERKVFFFGITFDLLDVF